MARNNQKGRNNNNPSGNNQYNNGWTDTARDHPFAAAAAVGSVVATGVFLWSRRNQISQQVGELSDQVNEWRETKFSSRDDDQLEMAGAGDSFPASASSETSALSSKSSPSSAPGRSGKARTDGGSRGSDPIGTGGQI